MRIPVQPLVLAVLCWAVPVGSVAAAAAESALAVPCRVSAVREPCRVEVTWRSSTYTVRLAGVECPAGGTEWGERSVRETRLLVGDESAVELRVEELRAGHQVVGQLLLADGKDLGTELVSRGLAWADRDTQPPLPNVLAAEGEARRTQRGLWGDASGPRPGEEPPASRPGITITGPAPTPAPPTRSPASRSPDCRPRSECCKVCSKGKACGNSCISASYTCHKGRGCACNAAETCS